MSDSTLHIGTLASNNVNNIVNDTSTLRRLARLAGVQPQYVEDGVYRPGLFRGRYQPLPEAVLREGMYGASGGHVLSSYNIICVPFGQNIPPPIILPRRAKFNIGRKNSRPNGRLCVFSVGLAHPVADAYLGEDVLRLGGVFLEFAADVRHVDAEDLAVFLGAQAPELAEHVVVGQDAARVEAEHGDYLVLVLREVHALAVHEDAALFVVYLEPAGLEAAAGGDGAGGGGGAGVAQRGAYARQQLRGAEAPLPYY